MSSLRARAVDRVWEPATERVEILTGVAALLVDAGARGRLRADGMTGFILAPLVAGGRFIGLLSQIRNRSEPWLSVDDRRFLQEVAARLAVGLETWPQRA